MINVSSAFREELNNDNRNYLCYVDISLKYGDTELQDTNSEFVLDTESGRIIARIENYELHLENEKLWSGAISIEESVSNTGSFDIGSTIINKATVVLNNIYDEFTSYDFTGAKVTIKIGLKLPDDTIETINKGIFYVDSPSYNGSLITLECLDSMSKFDRDYSESTLEYPATVRQIVEDACNVCGVSYATPSFDHDDYVIQERPETDSLTFRQMLNYIGQITCRQFSIDHNDRLISRWYDRSTIDELHASGESDGDYHIISAINSQNINQDDVVITGVRVTEYSKDSENPGGTYFYGIPGYVIDIKDNKLIPVGTGATIASFIGEKIVGMRFRPLDITFQNDPTIEPADVAEIVDYKGNHFYTFITNTNFTVGNSQTISCGAQSATRNSARRYSESTQLFNESKELIKQEKTERERAVEALNTALANSSGMYVTEEEQPDGSTITYLHDKPILEDSKNVIKITAEAIGISNDGGETYPYGLFLTGDLIARLLYVVGINADYINSGAITVKDEEGNITFYADTVTGRVEIRAKYVAIEGKTIQEIANEEAETVSESTLNDFISAVYDPDMENLQAQIDGQIETWFYDYLPTTSNYPASEWTTDADKDKHLGDLFYVIDNEEYGGQAYRWAKINNAYAWDYVEDTAVVKALAVASEAKDTADAKRRVFVTTPTPPYDVGDLWVGNNTSDLMRCQTARQSGNYNAADWIKAVKYTDDTYADQVRAELQEFSEQYLTEITNIQDQIDQKAESWFQPNDPSLDWTERTSDQLMDTTGSPILDTTGQQIITTWESEKAKHEGDLWKNSTTNDEYIYKSGEWVLMPVPDSVFDEIDGKAQVFVNEPVVPYYVGDVLFTGTEILVCHTERTSGVANINDWIKRDSYTTRKDLDDYDDALDQESIFNRLTNNGQMKGLYILDNQLYVNASYIRSGALVLGGLDNVNGIISVKNQYDNETGRWDASGITISNNVDDPIRSLLIQDGIIYFKYQSDILMSISTGFMSGESGTYYATVNTINSESKAYSIREYNPQPGVGNYKYLFTYFKNANISGNAYPGWYFGHDVYLNGNNLSFDTNARTYTEGYDNGAAIKTLDTFWINGNTNSIARFDQASATIWQPLYATIAGAPSDERLKTNIQDADVTAIPVFQNVKFREFDWIETGEHENIGIIAQELERLAPDLVSENHDIKYVNTNQLIMYCAKAIKELIDIVYPQQGEADTLSETASGAEMTLDEKKNWIEEVRAKYAPKPETEDSIVRARMEEGNGEEESGEDSSAGDGNGYGEI